MNKVKMSLTEAKSSGNKNTIQNGENQPMSETAVTYHACDFTRP